MQRSLESFGDVQRLQESLRASLEGYQLERVEGALRDGRILIADEVGLGKTASALAAIEMAAAYPAVVVTPASAEASVLAECRKWLPWRSSALATADLPPAEIVVLHPEVLERHRMALLRLAPKAAVLDEAHYFKEGSSTRSQAAADLVSRCRLRILLSGTPIKNLRADLLNQLELLGRSHEVVRKAYELARLPIPPLGTKAEVALAWRKAPRESLHRALEATVMYRTTHDAQGNRLTPVRRHQVACTGGTSAEYRALEEQFVAYCKELSLLKVDEKQKRAQARIRASGMLNGLRAALGAAKVAKVREWAQGLQAKGCKGIVFCYHRSVALMLSKQLPGRVLCITGDTPPKHRQGIVDSFARADFLVATMDSMAHGVNGLQFHASDVAFCELDYTHSKHEQSEGRLRRRGQKHKVRVYYLVAPGTYDEAMLAALQQKWRDAQGILDGRRALRATNFAEQVLTSIISQRPWETGGKIDWKAAGGAIRRGASVVKAGRNGPLSGKVTWVNGSQTSCRVEWVDGLQTFEVPGQLRLAPQAVAA